jgi:hypothetical protein
MIAVMETGVCSWFWKNLEAPAQTPELNMINVKRLRGKIPLDPLSSKELPVGGSRALGESLRVSKVFSRSPKSKLFKFPFPWFFVSF